VFIDCYLATAVSRSLKSSESVSVSKLGHLCSISTFHYSYPSTTHWPVLISHPAAGSRLSDWLPISVLTHLVHTRNAVTNIIVESLQFKTGSKDNSGYITQLKQQKSKKVTYLMSYRHIVNVLTSNIFPSSSRFLFMLLLPVFPGE